MTCIVAVVAAGRVFMAAERGNSDDSLIVSSLDPKIVTRGEFLFGYSGNTGVGQAVQYGFTIPPIKNKKNISGHMISVVVPAMRQFFKDNDIVALADGDYAHTNNAVRCDDDDEWYHIDDTDLVYCEYDDKYHHINNCVETVDEGWVHCDDAWMCYASSKYYSDNTDYVLVDGEKYHPDHTPAQDELFNTEE